MASNEWDVDLVRELATKLPKVEESTMHGAPSWKLGGKLLTCPAIHKSAEPNSLLVRIAPAVREELISTEPDTYYVTDHYRRESVVLVRLSKIDRESLQALLMKAWQFLSERRTRGRYRSPQTNAGYRANPPGVNEKGRRHL